MHKKRAIFRQTISRINLTEKDSRVKDNLVSEEPFTLVWQSIDGPSERLTSTMRTPGEDLALAAGILFSEGLLKSHSELKTLSFCASGAVNELNRLKAVLKIPHSLAQQRLIHRPSASMPQSACGMCAVDDLASPEKLLLWSASRYKAHGRVPHKEELFGALELLDESCPLFAKTGASHACLILASDASLLSCAEDVGRHNACDKAVGQLLLNQKTDGQEFALPEASGILFSSRLSFELASKATAAGVSWMASVGAPTHLAVELAKRCGIPLIGFLKQGQYNRYC